VSELKDRRAQKKAQTRAQVRSTAQRLFAERGFDVVTIADIAREADVAVQTVFNHFATKEELFFADRAAWVDGPADAIRSRDSSTAPLPALRNYLVDLVQARLGSLGDSERRCYAQTLDACPALRAHERELVIECERRLAEALLEAWSSDGDAGGTPPPSDPRMAARLTAAIWTATARVLIHDHRPLVTAGADPADTAAELGDLGERVLRQLEESLGRLAFADPADTGWPRHGAPALGAQVRQAG
jgi:AcrR family transcriptional regulator